MKGWFGKEAFAKIYDKVVHPLPLILSNLNKLIDNCNSMDGNYITAGLAQLIIDTPEMSGIEFLYREWLLLVITKFVQLCRQLLLEKNYVTSLKTPSEYQS